MGARKRRPIVAAPRGGRRGANATPAGVRSLREALSGRYDRRRIERRRAPRDQPARALLAPSGTATIMRYVERGLAEDRDGGRVA